MMIVISCILLTSCEAESTEGVSSVTYYPNITIKGETLVILTQGQTYNELGANAEAGGKQLDVKTDGTVDTSKPSVYKINYSSMNDEGFSAFKTRTVIVLSNTPSTINLEGEFTRNGNVNKVTRISDRKYSCNNATGYTGGAKENLNLTFYNLDDKQIYAPYQENASLTGISAESNIGTIVSKDKWYWVIYASGFFGTATRTFTR